MLLSFKPIKNWVDVNNFEYTNQWEMYAETPKTLYFQLINLEKDGLRYIPTGTYTLTLLFPPAPGGDSDTLMKVAVNPTSLDNSIFSVSLAATDTVFTGNVGFTLVQGGQTFYGIARQSLVVHYINEGGC